MKSRIWELDVFRGICILGMVLFHLLYDLQHLFHLLPAGELWLLDFVAEWGGVLFFLLSGICVTLGSHPIRRGLTVLSCGLVVTAVTVLLKTLGWLPAIIHFGVLHCLGVCMLLWPAVRKMPAWLLLTAAVVLTGTGFWLNTLVLPIGRWLFPLGIRYSGFVSADYFPLLPFFGFFLLGSVLGKTLYRERKTLFPKIAPDRPWIRILSGVGRWSLPVYMLHQPVITGILTLLEVFL